MQLLQFAIMHSYQLSTNISDLILKLKIRTSSMKYSLIGTFVLLAALSCQASAHGGSTDKQGGHFNRKISQYHCHKEPCFSIHRTSSIALRDANKSNRAYSTMYNRRDWPHWTDEDRDCQNTRAEVLIQYSKMPVKFKRNKSCNVSHGRWYDFYTGKVFTKASDVDIDHIVPLAHAHRHGAANWSRSKKRSFANDPENLIPVDDNTNQAKGDKGPDQWRPEQKSYWCEYAETWEYVKGKYSLTIGHKERQSLQIMRNTCQ